MRVFGHGTADFVHVEENRLLDPILINEPFFSTNMLLIGHVPSGINGNNSSRTGKELRCIQRRENFDLGKSHDGKPGLDKKNGSLRKSPTLYAAHCVGRIENPDEWKSSMIRQFVKRVQYLFRGIEKKV